MTETKRPSKGWNC